MSQAPQDSNPRPQDVDLIRNVVANNKVFIDTCSLLAPKYSQLETVLFPIIKEMGNKLIIAERVIGELKDIKADSNHKRCEQAHQILKNIDKHNREGLISIQGEKSDNFPDNVFLTVFAKFRLQHHLALITQDVALAHDLLKLNDSKSQDGKEISVFRITSYGTLGKNDGDLEKQQAARSGEGRQGDGQQGQNTINLTPLAEKKTV